ncbi:MAG: phage holin family protein [Chlorobiaceae bacterium]|nr:phage holin family protein [Chlorobiaceae bacterium]
MLRILLTWIINATAVYATALLLQGITIRNFGAALIVALVLGLVNALVKPVLVFFSIPFIILTLGLFLLVINALMLQLAAVFVEGFTVTGFWWAVLGSVCISFVAWLLGAIFNV